ncbi:hypothetical protein [Paraburkholderia sp. DHOC27]|uniref:hypothetical protein n=1 Tax=Paraburkholderia sp. DHOC27 TaxID=2303330 RepID=UPI000E3D1D8D|nr:hypothetical protein [Paraburkholderia sp. DHOC27]RFU47341.1 hypothetical protein D0B32_14555 [Paraburkholderia sp. DHOC27]
MALVLAATATATSLVIAAESGWARGGLPAERAIQVALGAVAVLYVHLLPARWRTLGILARILATALWGIGIAVVMYGQASFFMLSQQHAGNRRAETVPATTMLAGIGVPPGRTLTEIMRDVANVSSELAHAQVRRCTGDCPSLKAHTAILVAQLAALNAEAGEARRREAEEDRRSQQVDRIEALRATLRADPVAWTVASWFDTTQDRLELMMGVACAVVLEGASVVSWLLALGVSGHAAGRGAVVSDRSAVEFDREAVSPESAAVAQSQQAVVPVHPITKEGRVNATDDYAMVAPGCAVTAGKSADGPVTFGEDLLIKRIHEAVVTGHLKPTQDGIRKFLRCGQPKAGSLNRLYGARYGTQGMQAATQAARGQYANR